MKSLQHFFSKKTFLSMAIITVVLETAFAAVGSLIRGSITEVFLFFTIAILPILLRLFWFTLITRESKIFKTIYGYLLLLSLLVFGCGLLAKFEHWTWAGMALTYGGFGALLIYLIRFLLKKKKRLLDFIKLIFLTTYIILSMMILEHYIASHYKVVYTLLFYALIFIFSYEKDKIEEPQKEVFSFEENQQVENE